jgi:hypothetical protein
MGCLLLTVRTDTAEASVIFDWIRSEPLEISRTEPSSFHFTCPYIVVVALFSSRKVALSFFLHVRRNEKKSESRYCCFVEKSFLVPTSKGKREADERGGYT